MNRPTLEQLGGWTAVLGPLSAGRDLTADQTHAVLCEILTGQAATRASPG
jgi:hypothetical protein